MLSTFPAGESWVAFIQITLGMFNVAITKSYVTRAGLKFTLYTACRVQNQSGIFSFIMSTFNIYDPYTKHAYEVI